MISKILPGTALECIDATESPKLIKGVAYKEAGEMFMLGGMLRVAIEIN